MATSPESVRTDLTTITTAATAELAAEVAQEPPGARLAATLALLPLVVPSYYDAAGSLAVDWYDEIREESRPTTVYTPQIIGDPATDWIEREVERFRVEVEREAAAGMADLEAEAQRLVDEALALADKEIARGFRDTIQGNARTDEDAIGWSRVARAEACKLCVMLADRGAVYRRETANFAAHTNCHCAARPAFRNGEHGPEATVEQYLASQKRRTPAQRAALRAYLNENYPDARG